MNWRGRPLTSHEVVVNTIAATTTRTGLRVAAELDTASYPTGIKVSDDQPAQVPIIRHSWHGEWNYTVHPMPPEPAEDNDDVPATPRRSPSRHWLRDPALTGLTPTQWDQLIEKLRVARHAQREAHLHTRRGGTRHAAAGTGRKAVLTSTTAPLSPCCTSGSPRRKQPWPTSSASPSRPSITSSARPGRC